MYEAQVSIGFPDGGLLSYQHHSPAELFEWVIKYVCEGAEVSMVWRPNPATFIHVDGMENTLGVLREQMEADDHMRAFTRKLTEEEIQKWRA